MSLQRKESHIGILGLSASILCAIHCVSMPFLLSASALGTIQFISNPIIEITLILISIIFGYSVIMKGYRQHNKITIVILFLTSAVFLFIFGILIHTHESPITSIGGIGIALSFIMNWKAIQK